MADVSRFSTQDKIGEATMTEAEAISAARELAGKEGWVWVDPPLCTHRNGWFGRPGRWEIFSNRNGLGAKLRVVLNDSTGEIIEKGYIPR